MEPKNPNSYSMLKHIGTPRLNDLNESGSNEYSEDEQKAIDSLKELYRETIYVDMDFQRKVCNMQRAYEKKYDKIFDKRRKILAQCAKKTYGGLKYFWLNVLKSCYSDFINKRDEDILTYLIDIRCSSTPMEMNNSSFTIHFMFNTNPYFTNKVLTKTFYMRFEGMETPESIFEYDGTEIFKYQGCTINWLSNNNLMNTYNTFSKRNFQISSFFDMFSPPDFPTTFNTPLYYRVRACLMHDIEMGYYLKQRLIPKAILFFTGEIGDVREETVSNEESDDEYKDDENSQSDSEDSRDVDVKNKSDVMVNKNNEAEEDELSGNEE